MPKRVRTAKVAAAQKAWNLAHPDLMRKYAEDYRNRHPERMLLRSARTRAEQRDIKFTLKESDIIIPTHCPVLGIRMKNYWGFGRQGGHPDSVSLDRIDNRKGYVPGNVQVISHLANSMKSTATASQLRRFAKWITKEYGE